MQGTPINIFTLRVERMSLNNSLYLVLNKAAGSNCLYTLSVYCVWFNLSECCMFIGYNIKMALHFDYY